MGVFLLFVGFFFFVGIVVVFFWWRFFFFIFFLFRKDICVIIEGVMIWVGFEFVVCDMMVE